MSLLDDIYDRSNLIYLSDLKVPIKLLLNMDIIQDIADDRYSVEEWEYVYQYITEKKQKHKAVKEIKNDLYRYAVHSKDVKDMLLFCMGTLRNRK